METVEQRVIALVREFAWSEVKVDSHLEGELGMDSLDLIELLMEVEDEFVIEIDNESAEKVGTVQDTIDLVKRTLGQS